MEYGTNYEPLVVRARNPAPPRPEALRNRLLKQNLQESVRAPTEKCPRVHRLQDISETSRYLIFHEFCNLMTLALLAWLRFHTLWTKKYLELPNIDCSLFVVRLAVIYGQVVAFPLAQINICGCTAYHLGT